MLRDKSLIPLSHQHQRALALCVRIDRAQPIAERDLEAWQAEIEHFEEEIAIHFDAEEHIVFPAAVPFPELAGLVEELVGDHVALLRFFAQARRRAMSAQILPSFAQQFSAHIRKEERQLFEGLQRLMSAQELQSLGIRLEKALKDSSSTCLLPLEATRLRAKPAPD
jgi:hypothetical protein